MLLIGCHPAANQVTDRPPQNTSSAAATQNRSSAATPQGGDSLIVPGRSVGTVQLGDTREHAQQVFGALFGSKYYDEYTYQPSQPCWPQQCCEGVTKMHWLDYEEVKIKFGRRTEFMFT
jgi:hypothetical protein